MIEHSELYNRLFSIMLEAAEKAGINYPYSKQAFMYLYRSQYGVTNEFSLAQLSTMDFYEDAYISCLGRPIDLPAMQSINPENVMNDELRRKAILALVNSSEVKETGYHTLFINDYLGIKRPILNEEQQVCVQPDIEINAVGVRKHSVFYRAARKIWHIVPVGIRVKIRGNK